ncbi:MAG: hypothetical protein GTN99_06295 [Candidatus Dadabacteria bacterium]|nr:hypothetical protein [Candidatus Dadabacteria bacterium]NIT13845.1 hypothetical protein [Candidatus Dadabacteria bacterium]
MKISLKLLLLCITVLLYLPIHAVTDEKNQNSYPEHRQALQLINESLQYLEKAQAEKKTGNSILYQQYIQISDIKLKTSQSIIRNYLIKTRSTELQNSLHSIKSKNLQLQDEFRENISRLRQLKDKITLSEELIYNNSLNNLESALSRIDDAEQVDATIYSSGLLTQAYSHYKQASTYHKNGDYEQSVLESEKSIELAKQAYKQAVDKYSSNEKLLNELSNIFGFNSDIIDGSLTLTSNDIFSPKSDSIRFDLYPSLDKITEVIRNYDNLLIEVKSYNNSYKSSRKNLELSKKQKDTIIAYFISKGIGQTSFIENRYPAKELTNQRKIEIILKAS